MSRELLAIDETELGISWVIDEPMERACHAILADGRVWFVDPVDVNGIVDRAAGLGEPAGVLQLLDRHNRECAEIAERFGIEHLNVPDAVPGSPFEAIKALRVPAWKETALWWPERRVIVVAEIVGTHPMTNAGTGPVGVHPMLRLLPPRSIRGFDAEHLLAGHGPPLHADAAAAIDRAYSRSRRDIPRAAISIVKSVRR